MHTLCEELFVFLHISPACIGLPIIPYEKKSSRGLFCSFNVLLYPSITLKKLLKVPKAYVAFIYIRLLCFF